MISIEDVTTSLLFVVVFICLRLGEEEQGETNRRGGIEAGAFVIEKFEELLLLLLLFVDDINVGDNALLVRPDFSSI